MLTIAVLCIVITAPLGALGITFTQTRLLERKKATPVAEGEHDSADRDFIEEELPVGKDSVVDTLFPKRHPS